MGVVPPRGTGCAWTLPDNRGPSPSPLLPWFHEPPVVSPFVRTQAFWASWRLSSLPLSGVPVPRAFSSHSSHSLLSHCGLVCTLVTEVTRRFTCDEITHRFVPGAQASPGNFPRPAACPTPLPGVSKAPLFQPVRNHTLTFSLHLFLCQLPCLTQKAAAGFAA